MAATLTTDKSKNFRWTDILNEGVNWISLALYTAHIWILVNMFLKLDGSTEVLEFFII
jgi:hypothetical protein